MADPSIYGKKKQQYVLMISYTCRHSEMKSFEEKKTEEGQIIGYKYSIGELWYGQEQKNEDDMGVSMLKIEQGKTDELICYP